MRNLWGLNFDKLLVFFSQGYAPLSNFVIFKVLSDVLTVNEMGDYITVYSLAFFFTAFIGLGYSFYLYKNLASNHGLISNTWGRLVYLDLVSVICFFPLYMILAKVWVSESVSGYTIALIYIIESFIVVLITDISIVFQALQSFRVFSTIKILLSSLRLMCLLSVIFFDDKLFGYYLTSFVILALFYLVITIYTGRKYSFPRLKNQGGFRSLAEGLLFSFGNFSKNAYNDIDKIMLSNMAGSYEAGLYGVMYKIGNSIKLPLDTYLLITFPNYFKLSHRDIKYSFIFYLKKLKLYLLFAMVSVGLAFVMFMLIPYVFPKYEAGSSLLVIFSSSFLLKALYMPLADILTSSGKQAIRTKLQVLIGLINVAINIYLIKVYGMYGAMFSTILCELILLVLFALEIRKSMVQRKS